MKRLLVLLLCLSCIVQAQDESILSIRKFRGLNTILGDFQITPEFARVCHNVDLSRGGVGSYSLRRGYDSVSAISTGYDSLISTFPIYLNNGRRFITWVADSAGVGYGGIYYTADGSRSIASPAGKLPVTWNCQQPTYIGQLDDYIYFANGMQRQIVHDPTIPYTTEFPVYAPGEPEIIPLQHASGTYRLGNGNYRYLFIARYWYGGGSYDEIQPGVASPPVRSINGRMRLSGFQNIFKPEYGVTAVDSSFLMVFRTRVNPGPLSEVDTFFLASTIPARVLRGYTYTGYRLVGGPLPGGTFYASTFIDSLPDDSLGNWVSTAADTVRYWFDASNLDESYGAGAALKTTPFGATPAPKYGSAFMSNDSSIATTTTFCNGFPKMKDTAWAYFVTYLDTVMNVESDTSRACVIVPVTPSKQKLVELSLPQPPDVQAGIVRNIYRAPIYKVSADSIYHWYDSVTYYKIHTINAITKTYTDVEKKFRWQRRRHTITTIDSSFIGIPRRIAQVSAADTIYRDTLSFDSSNFLDAYEPNFIPSPLDKIFVFENRLAGVSGSLLYFSKRNQPTGWMAFDLEAVNMGDGDQITAAWSTRTAVRIKKNFASYNWFGDDGKSEVSGFIGCIASNSHSQSPLGDYFLSGKGVVLETEGEYLERTFNETGVSGSLKNFDNLSLAAKEKAVSIYLPTEQKYMLSIGDTSYVWDERAEGWSTWSMSFGGAFLYDTASVISFVPGQRMHFFRRGGRTLYLYGDEFTTDKGVAITSQWKTGPLFIGEESPDPSGAQIYEKITALGVWAQATSASDALSLYVYDHKDSAYTSIVMDSLTQRYRVKQGGFNPAMFYKLNIASSSIISVDHVVDGIDIFYLDRQSRIKMR